MKILEESNHSSKEFCVDHKIETDIGFLVNKLVQSELALSISSTISCISLQINK